MKELCRRDEVYFVNRKKKKEEETLFCWYVVEVYYEKSFKPLPRFLV